MTSDSRDRAGDARPQRRPSDDASNRPSGLALAVAELEAARPELGGAPATRLGSGLDHDALRIGSLVLRVGEEQDLAHELALLEVVRRRCPVAVPAPVAWGASWMAYPMLEGVPALELEPSLRARHAGPLAGALGAVLARLWATPRAQLDGLVDEDRTSLAEWREEAAELATSLANELPRPVGRRLARCLAAPLPASPRARVFSHNDLGCEHVLVVPQTAAVTGIIDWSDAAIVDPAKDLGLILRDLGTAAFERAWRAARAGLHGDDDLAGRAHVYACCLALEDLAFGLETERDAYVRSARDALSRLTAERGG